MLRNLLLLALLALSSPTANAQDYERIDVNSLGQPGNNWSFAGGMSRDGRFVVFTSSSTNLDGPSAAYRNVYLRDRVLGTTKRITNATGAADQANGCCISGDGSKIGFTNHGTSPTFDPSRCFIYDVALGTTTQIGLAPLQDVFIGAFNFDGTYAVVSSRTTTSTTTCVYRIEISTGATLLISRDAAGNPVEGRLGSIDDAGTHIAFDSGSSQIVASDTNNSYDVFVHDIPANLYIRASVHSNGSQANGHSRAASISADGRTVAFESLATNLAAGDTNGNWDAYLRDLSQGSTAIVSLTSAQSLLPMGSGAHILSGDASTVVFVCEEKVSPSDSPAADVFAKDLTNGALLPASPGSSHFAEYAIPKAVSYDGREVLFESSQSTAFNLQPDAWCVVVGKLGPRCSSSNYCTSLPNSTGAAATIGAQGEASRTFNTLVIAGVGLPSVAISMLISGSTAIDPGVPFGNGLLCVGGSITRHGIHVASGGVVLDHQDVSSPAYANVHPGDTRFYQIYYRDPAAGGAMFNTTDAVAITFCW